MSYSAKTLKEAREHVHCWHRASRRAGRCCWCGDRRADTFGLRIVPHGRYMPHLANPSTKGEGE